MAGPDEMVALSGVSKSFVMHLKGGAVMPVVHDVTFSAGRGECVVLGGPSGAGKSSILKMIYGSYRADRGAIFIRSASGPVDIVASPPRAIIKLRRTDLGYVSQFLRAIPRVSAIDLVAEAIRETGAPRDHAHDSARVLLTRLNIKPRLHDLPPATFSGGEQARINIARGFAANRPILLLDEPTASLDQENRAVVIELICEHRAAGRAIIGIFHDEEVRHAVATRVVDVTRFAAGQVSAEIHLPAE